MTSINLPADEMERIAIIGMAARFPGARTIETFWQNLHDGVESISFFSEEELEARGEDPLSLHQPNYVKAAPVLDDVELFDAGFFGFNPREAEVLDPQQRFFLECAWEALERAGYDPDTYSGAIGTYAGISFSTYLLFNLFSNHDLIRSMSPFQVMILNDKDYVATRAAYKLNLRGPSMTVQSACSTSLVAIVQACQSLLHYQCDMALAGGVSITIPHQRGYLYTEGGIFSPDGHCRAFDAKAQGTIFGSGIGIVVLKRLSEALADGDCIHAVIKGSMITNDGSAKVGYTAPGVRGQTEVVRGALLQADVDPETISYIETHGTGTALGDPIELAALTQAFRESTQKKGFCAIGSVKTNIGHLDAAAGVAGLIKTVLALKHRQIPPSLHFEQPNPQIDFANSPFRVNTALAEWKSDSGPRRAGVSAYGIGGTNAHVILEEAPSVAVPATTRPWQLLTLSARTPAALDTVTANLAQHLKSAHDLSLADVAYTLQVGRRAFDQRRVVVCKDLQGAANALESLDTECVWTSSVDSQRRTVAFMFSGQGAQYPNMGLGLYQSEATFRAQVDRCAELLKPHLGLDLREVLYPAQGAGHDSSQPSPSKPLSLDQTWLAQPALFTIEYALAKLWMEWGIQPQAMIGHSIGEYVAACLAGVFSLEDALALVAARGRLMQSVPPGGMLSVSLPEAEVLPLLDGTLSLAGVNGPALCVVAGPEEAIAAFEHQLGERKVTARRLHTSHAFHSAMMDPILESFAQLVRGVKLKAPRIPYVSNLTGTWITASEATDPGYWANHLRRTVRFAEGVQVVMQETERVLLEVGPGTTLSMLAKATLGQRGALRVLASMRHPQSPQADEAMLLGSLGRLWGAGVKVDWSRFSAREQRRRTELPTYPFERQRYWIEPIPQTDIAMPLSKRSNLADWLYLPSWSRTMVPSAPELDALAQTPQCWLLFMDSYGLGTCLVERLEQASQQVVQVYSGEIFCQESDNSYTIRPQCAEDYEALLQALHAGGKSPQRIVHLWSLTPAESAEANDLERLLNLGFYSLFFLMQAFGNLLGLEMFHQREMLHLNVISNHLQSVTGEEHLELGKAPLLGICKVIPQEYWFMSCRCLDIPFLSSIAPANAKLVDQLFAELVTSAKNDMVAYRGVHRWMLTYVPTSIDRSSGSSRLRERGVYLITGGLGGIGLVLAEHLARTVSARLILVGRSGLPERETWAEYLATHAEQDRVSVAIRAVQDIEDSGAEVLVARADASNLAQMRAVLEQAEERFGPINGVVHAAGTLDDRVIQLKTREAVEQVLKPKLQGTLVLETLCQDKSLDFLVLFSSISTVLGGAGQVDYCAANAFLDLYAQRAFSRPGPFTVAINWDLWQEVGMGTTIQGTAEFLARHKQRLALAIRSEEGMQVFDWVLQHGTQPQVVVSTKDLLKLLEYDQHQEAQREAQDQSQMPRTLHPRPALQSAYVAPETEVELWLAEVWQELLGVERIGCHDDFFELGGHSLLATQMGSRLWERFQVQLSLRTLFESPTIAKLAKAIEAEVIAKVLSLSDTELAGAVEGALGEPDGDLAAAVGAESTAAVAASE